MFNEPWSSPRFYIDRYYNFTPFRNRLVDVMPTTCDSHAGELSGTASDSERTNEGNKLVLMDENLINVLRDKPIYINEDSWRILSSAIRNDTDFLEAHGMMDYSLLVAIDGSSNQLILGIIDYVRVYTWDKQLESLIKSASGIVAGGKKPTVVAPDVYKKRFEHSMTKYFTFVPDYWHEKDIFVLKDITSP